MSKKRKKGLSLASKIASQTSALMMLTKKRQGKVTVSRHKVVTSNSATGSNLLSEIRTLEQKESIHFLKNMLSSKVSRDSAFNCTFPNNMQIKDSVRYINSGYGIEYDLEFEAYILASFGTELKRFLELQFIFDNHFLNSDLVAAKDVLQQVFNEFGYSNWYMSSKLNILYEEDDTKQFMDYNKKVVGIFKENDFNMLSEVYLSYPFIRCDKGISYDRYSFSIQHQLEEFRLLKDSSNTEQIDFAHFYSPEKYYQYISELLCENSANNMIDRYLGFRRILMSCYLHNFNIVNASSSLSYLFNETNDKALGNVLYGLGFVKPELDKYDSAISEICDYYVQGKYGKVIEKAELLISEKPTFTSIIEIYVKSLIRESQKATGDKLITRLINQLVDLYTSRDRAEKLKILQKDFLRLYHCDWAFFLKLQCGKFTPVTDSSSIEMLYAFLDIHCSLANPFSKIRYDRDLLEVKSLDGIAYNALDINSISGVDSELIENYRYIKIQGDNYYENGDYSSALTQYLELSKSDDALYKTHSLSRIVSCHFLSGDELIAISELSKLIRGSYNSHLLPLAEISKYIISSKLQGLALNELVDRAIVIYAYNLIKINEHAHFLTLLCEDIIDRLHISSPSEIKIPNDNKFKFLFEKILKPDVIETFDIFDSLNQVFIFRVAIVQNLIDMSSGGTNSLKIELFRTIEKLVKETCVIDCGTGRIEVDTLSIKNNLIVKLSSSFEALKEIERTPFEESDYQEVSFEKDSYNVSSNKFFTKTLDLYYKIRDEYTISPLYGLDNFLNMNIRHGGIVNLLWGPIKKHKLAYLKNEKGLYERENYWFEQYVYLHSKNRDLIDQAFRKFTKSIDKEIQTAKGWIHINTGEFNNDEKVFNFFTDADVIEKLADGIDEKSNFEPFLNAVIEDLVEQTNIALEKIKSLVESTLRTNIESCFNLLLNEISGIARLDELKRKIKLSQREVNEKVTELIGWMSWKNETTQPFLIGSSIDAAKEMALSLHPGFRVNLNIMKSPAFFIKGEFFRRFVTSFLILIDNAIVHAGIESSLDITLSVEENNSSKMIVALSNNVCISKVEEIKGKIEKINDVINKNCISGANEESGSGIFKVKKIFSYDLEVDNHIVLSICEDTCMYKIKIILDKGQLNDR